MKMMTVPEAAEYLGVIPRRVRQFIDEGRLPAQKLGRDWVINESDLKEFASIPRIRTGRHPSTPAEKE
jgi:excisionase family DNA binding protein